MTKRTHFVFCIDMWDASGENIVRGLSKFRWVHQRMGPWDAASAFANCGRAVAHVRGSYVPTADTRSAAKQHPYSTTLSARASSAGGTSRPRALAALTLITSSNLVGCSTGRSPGLAPLRILST
jgi:hypothetical protein